MSIVLITRPEPDATRTARRVADLGFVPLIAPLLLIQQIGSSIHLPGSIQATLLTSRNAVPGCPPESHSLAAFAVGDATAACAASAGFKRITIASGNAVTLAALVSETLVPSDGSLFLPTGRGYGTELARDLRQQGFRVIRHVVYQAVGIPALPRAVANHLHAREG